MPRRRTPKGPPETSYMAGGTRGRLALEEETCTGGRGILQGGTAVAKLRPEVSN